jgi:hypothetical protein
MDTTLDTLDTLADQAAETLAALMREGSDLIQSAIKAARQEASDQETEPRLRLSYTITLDLDTHDAEFALAFGVRHKLTATAKVLDPRQPELPMQATVTMTTANGASVTAPLPTMRAVVRELRKKRGAAT